MLVTRVLTASILIAALTGALFLVPRHAWIFLCAGCAASAAYEWGRLTGLSRNSCLVFAAGIALFVALTQVWSGPEIFNQTLFGLSAFFWFFLAPYWLWKHWMPAHRFAAVATGAMVISAAAIALIALRESGAWTVLCILGAIWISDSAAYFVGSTLGRHKLAPRISPGKTWEGVAGAMLFVALYAFLWAYYSEGVLPRRFTESPAGWISLIGLMLLLAVLGIYGDLFESYLKRNAGVKDSGKLLPGHGGVLDRIDALLPALPAAALVLT